MATPTTLPDTPAVVSGNTRPNMFGTGIAESVGIQKMIDDILEAWTKLGTGAAVAAADTVLRGTGAGTTDFGKVTTARIDANAITQADLSTGAASNPTTTSTSYGTLNGGGTSSELRVDMTTTGGTVLALLLSTYSHGTAGSSIFQAISLDGAAEVAEQFDTAAGIGYGFTMLSLHYFTGLSAAAHTFRGRWRTDAGTATGTGTRRKLFVVELKR